MIETLLVPVLCLALLAVLVTRLIESRVPETLGGLVLAATLASVSLWVLSGLLFALLYRAQIPEIAGVIGPGGLRHFAVLGLKSALLWGPFVGIVIVTAPRRWKTNIW